MGETDKEKDKDKGEEKISLTRKELEAILADRDREAKMPDDERRVRGIVRDEVGRTLEDKLPKILSDLFTDEGEPGDDQEPGDTKRKTAGKSIIDSFLGT